MTFLTFVCLNLTVAAWVFFFYCLVNKGKTPAVKYTDAKVYRTRDGRTVIVGTYVQ